MKHYTDIEKQRIALAIERTGATDEFFSALFSAAKVPDNASLDYAFARVRFFLAKKLLPTVYLDKEQFPFSSAISLDENSTSSDESETEDVAEDTETLVEVVAMLRHEYSKLFDAECFVSPHISLTEEIRLLETAIASGQPFNYWPEVEDA